MAAGLAGEAAAQMALTGVGTSGGKLEEPDHSSSNWYFARDDIEKRSPSRLDGIDLKKETYFRKSYCTFLQDLGMCLKVPQVTIATAIVFSHRFFLRQSHAKNDRYMIATICMFLAGKVEETPRPLRDVIITSFEIRHKKDPAAIPRIKQKEIYDEHKELVLMGERLVLTTLGFDLNIHHPYKPLVAAIKKLKVAQNALAQVAWNFVNDGLRTSLCLQFKPHHIAAGAIFLAAKFLKVKLPSDGEKVWWQEFEVTPRQLEEVSNQMLELYEQNKTLGPGAANGSRPSDAGTSTGTATNRAKGADAAPTANGHHWTHHSNATTDKVDKHAQTVKTEDAVTSGRREDTFQGSDNPRSSASEKSGITHLEGEYEPALENGPMSGLPEAPVVEGNRMPRAVANGQVRHVVQEDVKELATEAKSSLDERETGDVVDSRPGTESNGQSMKVKAEAEDEEPKKVLSANIQDVNTDRVKALKQKLRRSKGEGLDTKSANVKLEPTDEEELLERELESGVEAAAEAEKVKQERRGMRMPSQKTEHDGMFAKKENAEDGDFVTKRRRFNEEDTFNEKKRTKSTERGDRADWGDVELERSRPGVSADRVEEGELPSFSTYPYEQTRSPRPSDRRPMLSGSHENGSPSSKRYRDVHGRRDGYRDGRTQHGGGIGGGGGGGGRERDYHSRDHHHQHRQDGDRERYYHKDRDYQDRDHKKLRAHEVHGN